MKKRFSGLLVAALAAFALPAAAHHSFAIYDMAQNIEFDGVVETLKMRNPHMAMTLTVTSADGTKKTINFIEGAPANMIVRMGLNPADIAVGKPIKAIGAPRRDDPNAYFLKAIILPDGRKYVSVGN
jgi:VCBS repeat-containing protein